MQSSSGSNSIEHTADQPSEAELDDGDITSGIPASAVGLRAVHTSDSTGSNTEDVVELPSDPPVLPVSIIQLIRHKADPMSESNSLADDSTSLFLVRFEPTQQCPRQPSKGDLTVPVQSPLHVMR